MELKDLIHLARTIYRMGQDLDQFFDLYQVEETTRSEIRSLIIPEHIKKKDEGVGVGPGVDIAWVDRIDETEWNVWSAHEHYLRFTLNRPMEVVDSIADQSELILRRIPDPSRSSFKGKGLVIGYVQSGKTASYTAVAARAADAGYRLIIVLSGIHNNLRAQTQRRLDQELTSRLLPEEKGIERPARGHAWIHLTERGDQGDFTSATDPAVLEGQQPVIAVIKKICPILDSLLQWLSSVDPVTLAQCPVLIIDDEADQASVNTGQDRADEEPDDPDDEASPSRTNELIRRIITLLPRVSYLAYTATPFANVLIDPQSTDREAGQDLFPSDFVWQLPRPDAYTGTLELFGSVEHESRDVLRLIPTEDLAQLRPPRARDRATWIPEIAPSLIDAIDEFILAGAVRANRGQGDSHHTMLVHSVHYTDCQERIATKISEYMEGLRGDLDFGEGLLTRLHARWQADYRRSLDDADSIEFEEVWNHVPALVRSISVLELNSASDDELDFESHESVKAICIGGNRLSRGLTLEGLTVSVFVRTTGMADTLLQMARWYGFRIGYEDLIRIYTTPDIARWFAELALVEDDLRSEIDRLRASGLPPYEQGVRLRAHSALRLTSASKSRNALIRQVGWSGSHPQNIILPINDDVAMAADYRLTETFLADTQPVRTDAGLMAHEVSAAHVVAFLRGMTSTGEARVFDFTAISNWIERQSSKGFVTNWVVYVPDNNRRDATQITIANHQIGLTTRSRLSMQNSIGVLVDPKHEAMDLDGGPEIFQVGRSFDTESMRRARPQTQGLLLVYLLDPASDSDTRGRERLVPVNQSPPPAVVSVALSFPFVPDDEARTVVVGEAFENV